MKAQLCNWILFFGCVFIVAGLRLIAQLSPGGLADLWLVIIGLVCIVAAFVLNRAP